MDLNDAGRWYDKAYTLHYKNRDLEEAYYYYRYIIQHFSDSKEARYARQQIENLKGMNVLTDEIIINTENRLQNLGIQEAPKSKAEEYEDAAEKIIVTTCDLKEDYEIIGPVYFQVSNKGIFSSAYSELVRKYSNKIAEMKRSGNLSKEKADWGFLYGEWSVGQNDFEKAFYIAVEELKKKAALLDADAIIGMRQDIDLDTNGFSYFYLQMYGTAVKFK